MNNTIVQNIQNSGNQQIAGLDILISAIIFLLVMVFIVRYIYNFMKGYKLSSEESNQIEDDNMSNDDNLSIRFMNNQGIICSNCGVENDSDSKFCKNCGTRLY